MKIFCKSKTCLDRNGRFNLGEMQEGNKFIKGANGGKCVLIPHILKYSDRRNLEKVIQKIKTITYTVELSQKMDGSGLST